LFHLGGIPLGKERMKRNLRRVHSSFAFGLLAVAVACSAISVEAPPASDRFTAPPVYQLWWSMAEACSGITGSLADIKWYAVPNVDSISDGRDQVSGYWSSGDNRIVLIAAGKFNGTLVRHEMLHALLRINGHPRRQFVERCGGVVDCTGSCLDDAGAPPVPAAGTVNVAPDSLVLGIEMQPVTPGVNTFDGYFTIAVTARNPANHPVQVALRPSGDGSPSVSFLCLVIGQGTRLSFAEWAWDPEASYFAPGETKRKVFDLVEGTAAGAANIGLGTFTVQGTFGYGPHISQTIVLTP
jgi:hypothetical protein